MTRTRPTRRARVATAALSAPAGELPSPGRGKGQRPDASDLRAQLEETAAELRKTAAALDTEAEKRRGGRGHTERIAFRTAATDAKELARRLGALLPFTETRR